MMKSALPVSFRIRPDVKEAAEKAAADDHRSLSSFIEKVLSDHLKERGYLVSSTPKPAAKPRRPVKRKDESK